MRLDTTLPLCYLPPMHKPDKSLWVVTTYDELQRQADTILRAAGFTRPDTTSPGYLVFSMFETTTDGVREDLSDWIVKRPDFTATFAPGRVLFILGDSPEGEAVYSAPYTNPTWGEVLIEAERSCRGRGAPEMDRVFLEGVEPDGVTADGSALWELTWGS